MPPRPIHPDPIRHPPPSSFSSSLSGCGPHRSHRHLLHQRGHTGTFHIRLLEGRELKREHWSALSLVPGLSSANGEVSSFGMGRLVFWGEDDNDEGNDRMDERKPAALPAKDFNSKSSSEVPLKNNEKSTSCEQPFLPSMPAASAASVPTSATSSAKQSPLTPFDQGCLANMSPARSPFFPAFAQTPKLDDQKSQLNKLPPSKEFPLPDNLKPSATTVDPPPGPTPPHHYGRQTFRSSVIHNDSNPIWENDSNNVFSLPLRKDDLLPSLQSDGMRIALEIRLDEAMSGPESLFVGGASNAVGVAAAATSLVPVVGRGIGEQASKSANAGMEKLGLGTDRLIGKGYVDLMPLLLGVWEEEFDKENQYRDLNIDEDWTVDDFGKLNAHSHLRKRRVDRMGMLDVWIPLYRDDHKENHGKVHVLVSYEPNGMTPQKNDVVALESFARRPTEGPGPVTTPILPPLHPLLVVETRGSYLLCEYATSRTVTSVDRSGNVKSRQWERMHKVRIHRNSAFVIERKTLLDAVGDVARLPGDLVFSTPVGREVAEASAPLVAAAGEVVAPVFIWGRLLMAAGGTGVRAGLAGLSAATSIMGSAVVEGGRDKVRSERYEDLGRGEEGVYRYA